MQDVVIPCRFHRLDVLLFHWKLDLSILNLCNLPIPDQSRVKEKTVVEVEP